MKGSADKRIKRLEDKLRINQKRRIALVVYDANIYRESKIPPIDADVILYLPDNGFRIPHDKPMPPEGYLVKYL